MQQVCVESLPTFLDTVLRISREWRCGDSNCEPWYRGQSQASFDLTPGAYRPTPNGDDWDEDSMLNQFCTEARLLMDTDVRPVDRWEWYFAAQHYGLPTRLMDWSEDPLAALYFALRGNDIDTASEREYAAEDPPSVWMLEPATFNHRVHGRYGVYVVDDALGSLAGPWLPGRCEAERAIFMPKSRTERLTTNEWPMAIHPARTTRRIVAQAGKFTVHGSSKVPLNKIPTLQSSASAHLVQFVLSNPEQTWRDLYSLGYARFRLFPEPSTLADRLRKQFGG